MNEALTKITKSRTTIMLDHAFYAGLLMQPKLVDTKAVGTMAVDGNNLFYNPEFVGKLNFKELNFVLLHEVYHCIFSHIAPYRMGSRTALTYNPDTKSSYYLFYIAADYVINDILINDTSLSRLVAMPKDAEGKFIGLHDAKYHGMSTEQVYDILLESLKDAPKTALAVQGCSAPEGSMTDTATECDLSPHDDHSKFNGRKTNASKEMERKWQDIVRREVTAAKMNGTLPAGIDRLLNYIFEPPKVNWKDALSNYVTQLFKSNYRFTPPNKKYLPSNIILPSVTGEHIELVLAIDTSGSMFTDFYINMVLNELSSILSTFSSYTVHVIGCDATIQGYLEVNIGETLLDIKPQLQKVIGGGGGTSFVPVFDYIEANGIRTNLLIYFTDGYGTFPTETSNDYETIWLVPEKNSLNVKEFPFGHTVVIYED